MDEVITPSVSVSRDIAASASTIFAFIANPAMHPYIDGTGMAQSAEGSAVITKVGDVFVINMRHWSLGDYGMENHVVEFVPDRRIVWEPRRHTYETSTFPGGEGLSTTRYWGWELEPLGPDVTRVTEFYDCSRVFEGLREFLKDGEFWRKGMVESLENLERLVASIGTSDVTAEEGAAIGRVTKQRNYFEEAQRQS